MQKPLCWFFLKDCLSGITLNCSMFWQPVNCIHRWWLIAVAWTVQIAVLCIYRRPLHTARGSSGALRTEAWRVPLQRSQQTPQTPCKLCKQRVREREREFLCVPAHTFIPICMAYLCVWQSRRKTETGGVRRQRFRVLLRAIKVNSYWLVTDD